MLSAALRDVAGLPAGSARAPKRSTVHASAQSKGCCRLRSHLRTDRGTTVAVGRMTVAVGRAHFDRRAAKAGLEVSVHRCVWPQSHSTTEQSSALRTKFAAANS